MWVFDLLIAGSLFYAPSMYKSICRTVKSITAPNLFLTWSFLRVAPNNQPVLVTQQCECSKGQTHRCVHGKQKIGEEIKQLLIYASIWKVRFKVKCFAKTGVISVMIKSDRIWKVPGNVSGPGDWLQSGEVIRHKDLISNYTHGPWGPSSLEWLF